MQFGETSNLDGAINYNSAHQSNDGIHLNHLQSDLHANWCNGIGQKWSTQIKHNSETYRGSNRGAK